jgi:hypothetical protein
MMTERHLVDQISEAIAVIPANNPGYIAVYQETLGDILSRDVIRKIAQIAAAVASGENVIGPEN